ncbi:MAG TPA: ATP-binding protein [Chthonomonadaceae bacterium]|nr:ATP-binding protein [Chthonomonadaceae bacterium]
MSGRADRSSNFWSGIALSPLVAGSEASIIQALLGATDHGILMTDLRGMDVVCNPRFGELFGLDPQIVVRSTRDEVRRMALQRVKDPEGFTTVMERLYADPLREHEDEIELNSVPPRILRRYSGPVFDAQGQNIGRVWTFKDITETRRLQEEVQSYAARLEAQYQKQTRDLWETNEILTAMTAISAAIATDPDLPSLMWEIVRAVGALLGNACAGLLLKNPEDRLEGIVYRANGEGERAAICIQEDAILADVFQNRSAGEGAFLMIHPQAEGLFAHLLGCRSLILAALRREGQVMGVLAWGAARADSSIEPLRAVHLQAVADQVALALQIHGLQQDLRAAQERTVETAKIAAAGTLAVSIAQEIRNLMTPLQMELGLARRSAALSAARVQLNRLCALTHRLLALRDVPVLYPVPVAIKPLVSGLLPLVRPQAEIDGVTIRTRFARSLPDVCGDAGRLEHLFIILFLNALHAMAERGGRLLVTCAEEGEWVRIDVKDTGKGIPPEQLSRLFDPFYSTRTDDPGLGLFSAKRIVDEHEGRIRITSPAGGGTCVSVWLPTPHPLSHHGPSGPASPS